MNDVEFLIERCKAHGLSLAQCAYVLATVQHETNAKYVPVREAYWMSEGWRRSNLRYYPWYGRGYVQLTWRSNYKRVDDYFNLKGKLLANPDLMITDRDISANAMIIGMMKGWYGQPLTKYVNGRVKDYRQARRSVNVMDKADLIAGYARGWEQGLIERGYKLGS